MSNPLIDPEMQEIFDGFLVETNELLESLGNDLMLIESQPDDLDLINQIFRSFHTIKGTSSFMGFKHIVTITHEAEDLLNKLRKSELVVTQEIIDVLLEVTDWINLLIENIQNGNGEKPDYDETIKQIILLRDGESSVESTSDDNQSPEQNESDALASVLSNQEIANGSGEFTDDEERLIQAAFAEINSGFNAEPKKEEVKTEKVQEKVVEKEEVIEDKIEVKEAPLTPAKATPVAANAPKVEVAKQQQETIRIDVERVEILMDLSGELVLGRNRLSQITEKLQKVIEDKDRIRELIETAAQIDFVTSEIQTAVMKMRMVQVGKLYQKAPRIVRDLSKEFKKQIHLVVKGEETEIDRGIIEELNDPLVHMIRNSCDHGIETPEIRKSKGKPASGTITLDAEQEGNHIVLRISDDGAGMDPEKLKAKAIEKGILTYEQAAQMTNRDAFQIIFMPGFSTAAKITNTSGRGVGMDVVKTNIQNLKGIIEIESEINRGSTFIIKLPLTLAIIQGLLVRVQNETYAIPLSSVEEVVSIEAAQVKHINQSEVIQIRNDVFPLMRLDKSLNIENPIESLKDRYAVVVGLGMQKIGFVVDELLGQQEIVIKSLGEYLGAVPGVAGSTIMGDGRVIMIIDIVHLIKEAYSDSEYVKYA